MRASRPGGVVQVKFRHCGVLALSDNGRGGASAGSKGTVGNGRVREEELLVVSLFSVLTAT